MASKPIEALAESAIGHGLSLYVRFSEHWNQSESDCYRDKWIEKLQVILDNANQDCVERCPVAVVPEVFTIEAAETLASTFKQQSIHLYERAIFIGELALAIHFLKHDKSVPIALRCSLSRMAFVNEALLELFAS